MCRENETPPKKKEEEKKEERKIKSGKNNMKHGKIRGVKKQVDTPHITSWIPTVRSVGIHTNQ